jgi:Fe-S-cluster containining protein
MDLLAFIIVWCVAGAIAIVNLFDMKVPDTPREKFKALSLFSQGAMFGLVTVTFALVKAIIEKKEAKLKERELIILEKAKDARIENARVCEKFDKVTRKCSVYKNRPLMCDVSKVYDKYPSLASTKGLWFVLNHAVCDQLKKDKSKRG